ncbi:sugar phosphate isomerase/epimerase [soil metagenome]
MNAGLLSISFRQLSSEAVVKLAASCGLTCIEWGADIHVPPGHGENARRVGRWCRDAGLRICSYGSYYWLDSESDIAGFEPILHTALDLGAPNIRVWAGWMHADHPLQWERAVANAWKIADLAARHDVTISYEKHSGTLTENTASCARLLAETDHPGISTLWQPVPQSDISESLDSLQTLLPRIHHLHVFYWTTSRRPLEEGASFWLPHLALLRTKREEIDLLLEFVPDDDPSILAREAETLLNWISSPEEGAT